MSHELSMYMSHELYTHDTAYRHLHELKTNNKRNRHYNNKNLYSIRH